MNKVKEFLLNYMDQSAMLSVISIIAVTGLVSVLVAMIILRLNHRFDKTTNPWDDAISQSLGAPLQFLIWVTGLSLALKFAQLTENTTFYITAKAVTDVGVIISLVWFLLRFIKKAQQSYIKSKVDTDEHYDQNLVDISGKLLRLIVVIIAILVAMQTLGISVTGIITFGGVGGIAIGFAAKDLLSNFFGGLFIYLDRPFIVGEWVCSPDRDIEGTVEHIGWRVTRIRKFDTRPLYVPNSAFATISLENPSRMTNRQIFETIGVRYDDGKQINQIVEQVKDYLRSHPEIDQKKTMMVNFSTFAPSSLDFFIYCFTKTQSGPKFNNVKQEVLLNILKIIHDNDAQCAYPTTQLQLPAEFSKAI